MRLIPAPSPVSADRLTRLSKFIGRVIPDAMSTAVGMLLILALGALAIGNSGTAVMDAFYRGLWMLLPFTMQMALILVLSSTLGAAPVFKGAVARLSRLPRTHGQLVALACLVVACLGYLFWGLAVALEPLVTIHFACEAERMGIRQNVASFNRALQAAILTFWPIVVMYHLYGGVAGLLQFTTLGTTVSGVARNSVHPVHLPVLHRADFDRGGLLRTLERRPMGHSGLCDGRGRDRHRRLGPTGPSGAVDRRSDGESVDSVL